jgi:putative tricarboxylic transport membrane protein
MKKTLFVAVIGIIAVLSLSSEGQKEKVFPSKTIEIIVPSKAGGSTDAMARIFAKIAQQHREEIEFAIVNVPGSGGQQGFEKIASADPDGYTLGTIFTVQLPAHIISGRARYALDDFYYLGRVLNDPSIITVPKDSPVNTVQELIEYASANEMTASVNGIGSDDHLAMMAFQDATGVEFQMIPATGSTEQKAAIMGGHIDVAFMNISQMIAQHKAGDVKIMAILDDKRDPQLPELPTLKELGYDVQMTGTRGFVTPVGLPEEAQTYLNELFSEVMTDPVFERTLTESNQKFAYLDGDDYAKSILGLIPGMKKTYDKEPW